jgi:hypothetical protein
MLGLLHTKGVGKETWKEKLPGKNKLWSIYDEIIQIELKC